MARIEDLFKDEGPALPAQQPAEKAPSPLLAALRKSAIYKQGAPEVGRLACAESNLGGASDVTGSMGGTDLAAGDPAGDDPVRLRLVPEGLRGIETGRLTSEERERSPAETASALQAFVAAAKVSAQEEQEEAPIVDLDPGPPPAYPALLHALLGQAGTGKTWQIRDYARRDKGLLLCATTGIAAVNLGDAVTINSVLGYFDLESLKASYVQGWSAAKLRKLRTAGVTRIALDEVSMLEAEALDTIVSILDEVNSDLSVASGDSHEIGLTLIGDFLQLPPVKGEYCCLSKAWSRFEGAGLEILREIRRQSDPLFVAGLNHLRVGNGEAAAESFASCFTTRLDMDFPGVTVLTKNQEVDRFNGLRLNRLTTPLERFTASRWGKERTEWKHIPAQLALKAGALVMILANCYDEYGRLEYANGDLAIYKGQAPDGCATVELQRNGAIVEVKPVTRDNVEPTGAKGKRKDAYKTIGEITYMPLRLAYATTVHKSQGLTLDQVQIGLADHFWASPGMTYVGLSRARTLDGLKIVGNAAMLAHKARMSEKVAAWA